MNFTSDKVTREVANLTYVNIYFTLELQVPVRSSIALLPQEHALTSHCTYTCFRCAPCLTPMRHLPMPRHPVFAFMHPQSPLVGHFRFRCWFLQFCCLYFMHRSNAEHISASVRFTWHLDPCVFYLEAHFVQNNKPTQCEPVGFLPSCVSCRTNLCEKETIQDSFLTKHVSLSL